jgi:hypothetical protein
MHVEGTSADNRLHLVVHHSNSSKTPISLASGVVDIRAHIPFRVWVINPSNREYTLQKGMTIRKILPQPERVITVGAVLDEATPGGVTPEPNPEEVSEPTDARQEKAWQDEVDLSQLAPEEREADVGATPKGVGWEPRHRCRDIAPHCCHPRSKPFHSQPYRAGS